MFPCRKAITSKLAVWMRFNRSLHWFTGAHCYSMLHGSGGKNNNVHQNSLDDSSTQYGPYFDMSNSKNVTTILGKTTYLNCRVKNLGNKTVSERSNTYRVNSICFFQSEFAKVRTVMEIDRFLNFRGTKNFYEITLYKKGMKEY